MLRVFCYGVGFGLIFTGFLFYLLPPYVTGAETTETAVSSGIWMVAGGGGLVLLPIFLFRKRTRL